MGHTTTLGRWLDRFDAGETSARDAIFAFTHRRLEAMARQMLGREPRIRRWVETGDLLQSVQLRLHRSLADAAPEDAGRFYGLAALHLRRELIDLARSLFGPQGVDTNVVATASPDQTPAASASDGESLQRWAAFHEAIAQLPECEREVVDLLWYGGITQSEAAERIGVSIATVKRRWQSARLRLCELAESPI